MAQRNQNSRIALTTLGILVGLALALFVFSKVFGAVVPLTYNCANTTHNPVNLTSCCLTGASACTGASNNSATSQNTFFGLAISFITSLLPVVAIVGAYLVIKRTMKAMSL